MENTKKNPIDEERVLAIAPHRLNQLSIETQTE